MFYFYTSQHNAICHIAQAADLIRKSGESSGWYISKQHNRRVFQFTLLKCEWRHRQMSTAAGAPMKPQDPISALHTNDPTCIRNWKFVPHCTHKDNKIPNYSQEHLSYNTEYWNSVSRVFIGTYYKKMKMKKKIHLIYPMAPTLGVPVTYVPIFRLTRIRSCCRLVYNSGLHWLGNTN